MAALWPSRRREPRLGHGRHDPLRGSGDGGRLVRFLPPERLMRDERPVAHVPTWITVLLAIALAGQAIIHAGWQRGTPAAEDLPPAPSFAGLRLISFGEPQATARLAMLYLQSFDLGGANSLPYAKLDYPRLISWLEVI